MFNRRSGPDYIWRQKKLYNASEEEFYMVASKISDTDVLRSTKFMTKVGKWYVATVFCLVLFKKSMGVFNSFI